MLHDLACAQSRLPSLDVQVVVFNEGRLSKLLRERRIATFVLPEREMSTFSLVAGCRRIMKRFVPDVVHSHRIKEDIVGGIAAALEGGIRCVRTVHGVDEAQTVSLRARFSRAAQERCVRRLFAASVAVSRPLQRQLEARFGSDRVFFIANGVDLEQFGGTTRATVTDCRIRIGMVGRLVPIKRVDVFLNMAAIISRRMPGRFQFLIYGDGPEAGRLVQMSEPSRSNHRRRR